MCVHIYSYSAKLKVHLFLLQLCLIHKVRPHAHWVKKTQFLQAFGIFFLVCKSVSNVSLCVHAHTGVSRQQKRLTLLNASKHA